MGQSHRQDKLPILGPSTAHPQRVVRLRGPGPAPSLAEACVLEKRQRGPPGWGVGCHGLTPCGPSAQIPYAQRLSLGAAPYTLGASGACRYGGAVLSPQGATVPG